VVRLRLRLRGGGRNVKTFSSVVLMFSKSAVLMFSDSANVFKREIDVLIDVV
jgi:hypothetical protein